MDSPQEKQFIDLVSPPLILSATAAEKSDVAANQSRPSDVFVAAKYCAYGPLKY